MTPLLARDARVLTPGLGVSFDLGFNPDLEVVDLEVVDLGVAGLGAGAAGLGVGTAGSGAGAAGSGAGSGAGMADSGAGVAGSSAGTAGTGIRAGANSFAFAGPSVEGCACDVAGLDEVKVVTFKERVDNDARMHAGEVYSITGAATEGRAAPSWQKHCNAR